MNQEIKAQWVAALRSGKYRQGAGRLRTRDDHFCCLGVLCELAVQAKVIPNPRNDPSNLEQWGYGMPDDRDYSLLPLMVARWAELPDSDPGISTDTSLASLNDEGTSFSDIARIIEEKL